MFDLLALAFQADITRVFVFTLGKEQTNRAYPERCRSSRWRACRARAWCARQARRYFRAAASRSRWSRNGRPAWGW